MTTHPSYSQSGFQPSGIAYAYGLRPSDRR